MNTKSPSPASTVMLLALSSALYAANYFIDEKIAYRDIAALAHSRQSVNAIYLVAQDPIYDLIVISQSVADQSLPVELMAGPTPYRLVLYEVIKSLSAVFSLTSLPQCESLLYAAADLSSGKHGAAIVDRFYADDVLSRDLMDTAATRFPVMPLPLLKLSVSVTGVEYSRIISNFLANLPSTTLKMEQFEYQNIVVDDVIKVCVFDVFIS